MGIIYVQELPDGLIIKSGNNLLVGTGKGKGDETHEGLCSQEGK